VVAEATHKVWSQFEKTTQKLDAQSQQLLEAYFEGTTLEEAFATYENATRLARVELGEEGLESFADVWLSHATRAARLHAWQSFWTRGRIGKLSSALGTAAAEYGFSEDVFDPFLTWVADSPLVEELPADIDFLHVAGERFISRLPGRVMMLAYFPDTRRNLEKVRPICGDVGGDCYVVSRRSLSQAISQSVQSEIVKLSLIAGVLIVLLLFILLRRPGLVLLASIPVATSLACLLAVLAALGMSLNAASMIAALLVVGLCIDYGIFMVYHQRRRGSSCLRAAVGLSAATTLVGAGSLVFAVHPVMRSIGVAATSGVASGYLGAVAVIPAASVTV
jgi:hypothetical protein